MTRATALVLGMLAWAGVAAVAVTVVNAWQDENQVLAFLPILAAVVVAWAIGELVTARVFAAHQREVK
ncbi:MAG TPA: hypothetical protein VFC53_01640 [Dehalococcoidia bacterium]|jgi:hypothetical protein|nr:hypothetical protein [Dehalococcoidia bacterium]